MCDNKNCINNEISFSWGDVLGNVNDNDETKNIKNVLIRINNKFSSVSCVRTLCLLVSNKAKILAEEFVDKRILTNEISQVFIYPISSFIEKNIKCFDIINEDTITKAKLRNAQSKLKFGYMWNNRLLNKIASLVNSNYKFIGVIESPKPETSNRILRKYPNINLNIPGGKLSIDPKELKDDPELMCIKEGLREMKEETGIIISGGNDEDIYHYFGTEHQLYMREKYGLINIPLSVLRPNVNNKGDLTFIWLL